MGPHGAPPAYRITDPEKSRALDDELAACRLIRPRKPENEPEGRGVRGPPGQS
jgi:hypothetical protein